MALLITDCPHCPTRHSAMIVFGVKSVPLEKGTSLNNGTFQWDQLVGAVCQNCSRPISALLSTPLSYQKHHWPTAATEASKALLGEGTVISLGYTVKNIWPQRAPSPIPEHLPASVAKAFRSAESNYATPDGEDAAAMLYRRAIDVAIREKHPELKGLLAPRIAQLVTKGLLPPSMKDWADQIRLIGNDGAHEPEGVTMDELTPMRGFTEAFLRYFITIPFEVALRRGEIDADGNPAADPST